MRKVFFLAAGLTLCVAQAAPLQMRPVHHLRPMAVVLLPDSATALYARQSARLTPRGHAWVAEESQRLRNGSLDPSLVEAEAAQSCAAALGTCSGADIEELCFLVLMQAANAEEQDLQEIMNETKAQNTSKNGLRQAMQATQQVSAQKINHDLQDMRDRLDSMNEMSEMTSMRLQMAMDRLSKLMESLSNILKKISDSQQNIIKNMK